jgi:hypothetical protein
VPGWVVAVLVSGHPPLMMKLSDEFRTFLDCEDNYAVITQMGSVDAVMEPHPKRTRSTTTIKNIVQHNEHHCTLCSEKRKNPT